MCTFFFKPLHSSNVRIYECCKPENYGLYSNIKTEGKPCMSCYDLGNNYGHYVNER